MARKSLILKYDPLQKEISQEYRPRCELICWQLAEASRRQSRPKTGRRNIAIKRSEKMQLLFQNLVDLLRLRGDLPVMLQKVVFLIPASKVRMIITPTTSSCIQYYKIDESHIGAVGVFPLISRCPQRSIVVKRWNHPLSSDHVYDSLIFSNVVLHLFLDVCIVF